MLYYIHCGSVAQLVEQRPEEPCVVGSSPTGATKEIIIFNQKTGEMPVFCQEIGDCHVVPVVAEKAPDEMSSASV